MLETIIFAAESGTKASTTVLDLVANILAYMAVIPISLFIYFYGTRAIKHRKFFRRPSRLWMSTRVGKALMLQMIAWLCYLIFIGASLLFPEWRIGRDITRLVIYSSMAILFWEFFIALRKLQKQETLKGSDFGVTLDSDIAATKPRRFRKPKI